MGRDLRIFARIDERNLVGVAVPEKPFRGLGGHIGPFVYVTDWAVSAVCGYLCAPCIHAPPYTHTYVYILPMCMHSMYIHTQYAYTYIA